MFWNLQTGHSFAWRMLVNGLIGASIFILLPEGLRLIHRREVLLSTPHIPSEQPHALQEPDTPAVKPIPNAKPPESATVIRGGPPDSVPQPPKPVEPRPELPKTKPVLPEKPPTLIDLFKDDFSNTLRLTDEIDVQSQDGILAKHIKRQLYLDFFAKAKFMGFYVPPSGQFSNADANTERVCIALADIVQLTLDGKSRVAVMGGYKGEMSKMEELTFSGRVFLYHEDFLSIVQKAAIIEAYSSKHFDVQFRGPDYLGDQIIAWHHQHDAKETH